MLLRLTVDDVGLIAHAEIAFAEGFTVFTGETGSGKTMLLGALDLALGGRTDRDLVRGERARVALELVPEPALREHLAQAGIALAPDDDVVIVRELTANGRAAARVNGVPVSATQLRELGALIVDAIGQGEALRLLEPGFARELLDRFGGAQTLALRAAVRAKYDERRRLADERDALREETERAAAIRTEAREALAEIDAAGVVAADEDVRLRERREVLANAERIAEALGRARAALEDDGGAVDALGVAAHALTSVSRFGARFEELADAAAVAQGDVGALAARIARAADDVELDPHELEAVSARLDALDRLKRKYGGSLAAMRALRAEFAAAVDAESDREQRHARVERELHVAEEELETAARALHEARVAAAASCDERIARELRALAMPAARFGIAVVPADLAAHGADRVEFRFSANPGEPERPLAKVASGGERSRLLLAAIVVLAEATDVRTFVFDEVDAGIGGATAVAVGTRLAELARRAQVACVTHLAQIAVWGDAHYALRKREDGAGAEIAVVRLDDEGERLAEIARMLSGGVTVVSLQHAAALLRDPTHAHAAVPEKKLRVR